MERSSISSISLFLKRIFKPAEKVICYHCGEQSTPSRTLYITFEGETRAVCCSGCAAILKTVEELGICDEYHAHKIETPQANVRPN